MINQQANTRLSHRIGEENRENWLNDTPIDPGRARHLDTRLAGFHPPATGAITGPYPISPNSSNIVTGTDTVE
jgi:hypothetical protein